MLPYSKFADEPRSEDECMGLLWRIMIPLAALEFGTVPVVYLLGRLDKISVAHDVIAGLYVVVAVMKVAALRFLRGPRGSALRRAYEDAIVAPEKLPVVGTELCCWPKGFTLFFTTIPTYCETQATALAIGAAAKTWSPCDQAHWEASWANTPGGVLEFVGWMTLPTVLGLMLFLQYIVHIASLWGGVKIRDASRGAESFSTTSGLMMIAAVLREKNEDETKTTRHEFADVPRIISKLVFGTGPRLWLKISLLGILMQSTTDTGAVRAAQLAVCMSFFHAFQIIWATRECMKRSPIFLLVLVPLLMCMVRFAGTSLCDSHVFNLSTASCVYLHECSS